MWQFKKLPPRTGSRGGEIRVPGSSPRYSSDDLLRRSSSGLVRCLLLVFPLSSRDYLALHLSAALLDYRPSRSTQFRMTRPLPLLSLSFIPFSCSSILLLPPSASNDASRASIHRSYVLLFSRLFARPKQCFAVGRMIRARIKLNFPLDKRSRIISFGKQSRDI